MRARKSKNISIKGKSALIFWTAVFGFLILGSSGLAAPPVNGEALAALESFDNAMIRFINKHDIPGGSLAVSFKGRLILAKGYGYSDFSVFKKIPAHPKNRFRFASLSKPLTATAIMSFVEQGKLSLDSKIVPLLLGNPYQKITGKRIEQITIQHLLEHRGEWKDDRCGNTSH
jgi:N-acyl-D-amino-acid deacylase